MTHQLSEAFDRLEDFIAVWSDGIPPDAVDRLQESVGIDADLRAVFARRLETLQPHAHPGAVLLGLLLGLSAAQLADAA
jgi:hypothetical protein